MFVPATLQAVGQHARGSWPRGVLHTPTDGGFHLSQLPPPAPLSAFVALVWLVRWDRRGLPAHTQSTLPHPAVQLVIEHDGTWLYGPPRRRFQRTLRDAGSVLGIRFRPGAARCLLRTSVSTLSDRRVAAAQALPGLDDAGLVAAATTMDEDAVLAAVGAALTPLLPLTVTASAELVDTAVTLLEREPQLKRAEDLAQRLGVSLRSLHRLFADHVGVGPGWVARRFRLQEAAAHAATGARVEWSRLANELGYCDQAHLIREFTRTIGTSPRRYAMCARSPAGQAQDRRSAHPNDGDIEYSLRDGQPDAGG